ncbi:MAG: response regulator transcription factor [Gammaproteobacteria bacterium]
MISEALPGPRLLLVDDDETFCGVLGEALEKRGFAVRIAHNVPDARRLAEAEAPHYAVVDLRMPGPSGLELVSALCQPGGAAKVVVLTGYASITTAVEAIKLGATHYLTKPTDADEIVAAFDRDEGDPQVNPAPRPISVDRLEWEHIQRILTECTGNVSSAARRLGMHRRTLQRKLNKRPSPM